MKRWLQNTEATLFYVAIGRHRHRLRRIPVRSVTYARLRLPSATHAPWRRRRSSTAA
jgi:hypothetical protein